MKKSAATAKIQKAMPRVHALRARFDHIRRVAFEEEAPYVRTKADLVYKNTRMDLVLNMIGAVILLFALRESAVPMKWLLCWFGGIVLVVAARTLVLVRYDRESVRKRPAAWLQWNQLVFGLSGVLWGIAGMSLFFDLTNAQTAFVVLALACITSSVAANGVHFPLVASFTIPALLPIAMFYLVGFGQIHKAVGILVLLYGALLLLFSTNISATVRRTVGLAHKNDQLVKSVQDANDEIKKSSRRFQIIADYSHDWECWFDASGKIVWTSPSSERMTGYTPDEYAANPNLVYEVIHEDDRDRIVAAVQSAGSEGGRGELQFRVVHRDGTVRWCASVSQSVYNEAGKPAGFRASVRDISVQKALEAELQELASTDGLTGILNRRAFLESAQDEAYRTLRYGNPLTVAMIDVDHFKQVNDTHGHEVGDRCLKALVDVVTANTRSSDRFGRFGGEEFILMFPETDVRAGLLLCERLRQKVEEIQVESGSNSIGITVSIGVADVQANEASIEDVIARADEALYKAKRSGRNQVVFGAPKKAPDPPAAEEGADRALTAAEA